MIAFFLTVVIGGFLQFQKRIISYLLCRTEYNLPHAEIANRIVAVGSPFILPPSDPSQFQLERIWPDKVPETTAESAEAWTWFGFYFLSCWCSFFIHSPNLSGSSWPPSFIHIPSLTVSKEQPGMRAIIINVKKYMHFCAMDCYQSSTRYLSRSFVSNLLLSDLELSSCANSLQHVRTKMVTVAPLLKRMEKKKSQAPLVRLQICSHSEYKLF